MLVNEVSKLSSLDRFLYWIWERHRIHLKRQCGDPKPWTDDQILQDFFFTNPYRENDKITVWFREHIRDPRRDNPSVLFATICYRWFNTIPTGEALIEAGLLDKWETPRAVALLTRMRDNDEKVFTGAFTITNGASPKPKVRFICEDCIAPIWYGRADLIDASRGWETMEAAHKYLRRYTGFGGSGFMAYEVVCDLRYTWVLKDATDKCTWSNPGPGAQRGINRLLQRPLGTPVKDWPEKSQWLLENMQTKLSKMPKFEMRDCEHSLCEFDKYCRAMYNEGRLRRRYNGRD